MADLTIQSFAARFGVALVFGALIGLERQWRHRMAGTRTNALVAGGAAAFVMSGTLIAGDATAQGRIVSYVVSGVGFLGAGLIFLREDRICGVSGCRSPCFSATFPARVSSRGASRRTNAWCCSTIWVARSARAESFQRVSSASVTSGFADANNSTALSTGTLACSHASRKGLAPPQQ